jgi:hypothetical protein
VGSLGLSGESIDAQPEMQIAGWASIMEGYNKNFATQL